MLKRFVCLLIFLPSLATAQQIENLVFEGSGIRGIGFCGALEVLDSAGFMDNIKRVSGTSAGAITASMLAVGYSPQEIREIIYYTDFQEFNDGERIFVGGTERLLSNFGWYKGEEFMNWLESHIQKKTGSADITLKELHQNPQKNYLDVYVMATNLSDQKSEVLSYETHPDMRLVDAVRISMSVPLWFQAIGMNSSDEVLSAEEWDKNTDIMIDGGLVSNFPIHVFDEPHYYSAVSAEAFESDFCNPATIGVRIDTQDQIENDHNGEGLHHQEITNLEEYISALYIMVIENLNRQNLRPCDWERTLSIDSGEIGPRVKKLSREQKDFLIESGKIGARTYIASAGPIDVLD
jgi:NTE family protein